jgi:hypothetical protein
MKKTLDPTLPWNEKKKEDASMMQTKQHPYTKAGSTKCVIVMHIALVLLELTRFRGELPFGDQAT